MQLCKTPFSSRAVRRCSWVLFRIDLPSCIYLPKGDNSSIRTRAADFLVTYFHLKARAPQMLTAVVLRCAWITPASCIFAFSMSRGPASSRNRKPQAMLRNGVTVLDRIKSRSKCPPSPSLPPPPPPPPPRESKMDKTRHFPILRLKRGVTGVRVNFQYSFV